jgi:hypothetical protein
MYLSEGHVNITSPSPICLHTVLLRRCSYYHPLPSTLHYTTLVLPVVYIVTTTNMRRSCVLMCCPVLCELLNASDNGQCPYITRAITCELFDKPFVEIARGMSVVLRKRRPAGRPVGRCSCQRCACFGIWSWWILCCHRQRAVVFEETLCMQHDTFLAAVETGRITDISGY